jgi:hypothetical protein
LEKKKYRLKRSVLNAMKKEHGMETCSDRDFLEWWRRNFGTGYEAFENIEIIEGE